MQQRETAIVRKLVLSAGGRVLREVTLSASRTTIGRRPYNDIALDDLTVSGEHAVLHCSGREAVIHDLKSRNGTFVNQKPVMQKELVDGDRVDIGIYRLQFVVASAAVEPERPPPGPATLSLLGGNGVATRIGLERPITSIGNSGACVAVVARRRSGYWITHLEGPSYPLVNGEPIGLVAHPLNGGDLIELGGVIYQFRLGDR